MKQSGKWLSFILLFSSFAYAQAPYVDPQISPQPPYDFLPQLRPQLTNDLPGIELDPDSSIFAEAWGNCLQADVWVLVDYSSSMRGFEVFIAQALANIASGIIQENSNRRMGYIYFNDNPKLQLGLTTNIQVAYKNIESFSKIGASGGTQMNDGLTSVSANHIISPENKNAKSSDFKKIIILISDGQDIQDKDKILQTSNKLKNEGWWIYSIMATKEKDQEPLDENPYYQLLRGISGNPFDTEETYVDSILLADLPQHFNQKFSCM